MANPILISALDYKSLENGIQEYIKKKPPENIGVKNKPFVGFILENSIKKTIPTTGFSKILSNLGGFTEASMVSVKNGADAVFDVMREPTATVFEYDLKASGIKFNLYDLLKAGIKIDRDNTSTSIITSAKDRQEAGNILYNFYKNDLSIHMERTYITWDKFFHVGNQQNNGWNLLGLTQAIPDRPEEASVGGLSGRNYEDWRPQTSLNIDATVTNNVKLELTNLMTEIQNRWATQTPKQNTKVRSMSWEDYKIFAGKDFIDVLKFDDLNSGNQVQLNPTIQYNRQAELIVGGKDLLKPYTLSGVEVCRDPALDSIGKSNYAYIVHKDLFYMVQDETWFNKLQDVAPPFADLNSIYKAIMYLFTMQAENIGLMGVASVLK